MPGCVTPQCHLGAPRLRGDCGRAQPHSPIEGGAGAVIDHLTVALHLQIRLAVVTAIVLELVDGLRGHGCQGPGPGGCGAGKGERTPARRAQARAGEHPEAAGGKGGPWQERGGRAGIGGTDQAGERPGRSRLGRGTWAGKGGPGSGGPTRAGKRPGRAERRGPGPKRRRAGPAPFPVPP